jgi:ABC-type transport system substrate-binding protein
MTSTTRRLARCLRAAGVLAGAVLALAGCNNNPLPDDVAASNTLVSAFTEKSPRHLDPTASYWNNETPYTYQIYEPLYGYHYLKRPYTLVPKTAVEVVAPRYLDRDGKELPADAPGELVAQSVYDIRIKPGILYQPHPAFAKDAAGRHLYHAMKPGEIGDRRSPLDFEQGTSWWPRTTSTRSSDTPRRASRRRSTASSRNTCWG